MSQHETSPGLETGDTITPAVSQANRRKRYIAIGGALVIIAAVGIGIGIGATGGKPVPRHAPPPPAIIPAAPALAPIADTVMIRDGYGTPRPDRQSIPTTPQPGNTLCSDGPWSPEDQYCGFGTRFIHDPSLEWDLIPTIDMFDSIFDAAGSIPELETPLNHGPFQKVPSLGSAAYIMPLFGEPKSVAVTDATKVSGASLEVRDRNIIIGVNFWCQTYGNNSMNVDCLTYQRAKKVDIDIVNAVLAKLPYKS